MANITYLSVKDDVPATGYWDHTFINDMFKDIGESDRHVFIIPGAYQWDVVPLLNKELQKHNKVLVIITSDEEGKFDTRKLEHDDMIVYSQYGNGGRYFPLGYTPGTREILKELGLHEKINDWFFAGQITHPRRKLLAEQLIKIPNGYSYPTDGFAKGMDKKEYLYNMVVSKTAPCSPGPVAIDSFRLYEALEAGSCPIADDMGSLRSYREKYWEKLFGDVNFPTFVNYEDLPMLIDKTVNFPNMNNMVMAWWINKKHQFREQLKFDLGIAKPEVMVVIPVSPIPSHPHTDMIEETIRSIRVHLPNAPIVITFDGVRKEQKDREKDYWEFQRRLLWKINFEYENILPVIFPHHVHQTGMMKTVLNSTDIPMLLYVEHDTPLTPDREIDWDKCKDYIRSGKSNVIRFHFEAHIPEEHKYLMIGEPEDGFQKTAQWSQRPHLASTEMYKIVIGMFSKDANCFIEDYIYGQFEGVCREQGMVGWNKWKVHIYHPEGDIKRSYNLDGRKDDKKYVEEQKW